MDVPSATGTAPTITLGDLKTQYRSRSPPSSMPVTARRSIQECVLRTYDYERVNRKIGISVGR